MLSSPLKKTRLMRYSTPLYNSMYNSFLNRFPIKPNLIYVNTPLPVPIMNINKPLKNTQQKLCHKNKNKINKYMTFTTVCTSGTLILTFFYSYYSYYRNTITILTMYK